MRELARASLDVGLCGLAKWAARDVDVCVVLLLQTQEGSSSSSSSRMFCAGEDVPENALCVFSSVCETYLTYTDIFTKHKYMLSVSVLSLSVQLPII